MDLYVCKYVFIYCKWTQVRWQNYIDINKIQVTALTIALHRGLYLVIIMDRYEGPRTSLTIALH
jgi:hypothetical protein